MAVATARKLCHLDSFWNQTLENATKFSSKDLEDGVNSAMTLVKVHKMKISSSQGTKE